MSYCFIFWMYACLRFMSDLNQLIIIIIYDTISSVTFLIVLKFQVNQNIVTMRVANIVLTKISRVSCGLVNDDIIIIIVLNLLKA